MGLAHTRLIRALQGRSKATNDAGMAHLTSKAGSKRVKKMRSDCSSEEVWENCI